MKCPSCGSLDSKVIDSRLTDEGSSIRRRRECTKCAKRFTTYETIEMTPIMVIKKSGNRQTFSPQKLKNGILKACEKRPVPMYKIDKLIEDIEKHIANQLDAEVTSKLIGDLVMEGLKDIDDVAYVRFAAVHRQFKDISTWLSEIEEVLKAKGNNK
ncbi:MAG: transcriptional repressor NrdR [Clostridia bacterium]|jgi:transcriptional repressor NrdR|nr:transcriptional repressor NrdR [Clostridia bacterium]MCX4366738.1 transcriptional regulator NrdR [Clostridia bacterium]